jgi:3-phenylpropionate/trans-cinnamate dioxygenase ferredoxin subunit
MSSTPKYNWHKIAESMDEIEFSSNGMAEIKAGGKTFCVARYNSELFACTQKCPHAGGILSEGYLDASGNIVCPLHRYKFNIKNGRNTSGEGYYLKTYPVELRSDGVYVGTSHPSLL